MLPSENVSRYILTVCDRPRYLFNELCYSSFVNLALAFQTLVAKKMNLFSGGRGSKGTQRHETRTLN